MKFKTFSFIIALALIVALFGAASPVSAAAYGTSFVTSVTYMNIGTGSAAVTMTFYAENNATPISIDLGTLAQNASSSIYVGSVGSVAAGFKGSAVMSSNQPLAATMVQVPPAGSTVKNRPLSNGFSTGSNYVLVPTALKATFDTNSILSIQNIDTEAANVSVVFVPVGGGAPVTVPINGLPAGAAKYLDLGTMATLPATFNGSVQITSVRAAAPGTPGQVVATSLEASTLNNNVYAFEGVSTAANTLFMPSAFCNWSGGVNSAYAVQNTGTAAIDIKVTYDNGKTETKQAVAGGAKVSFAGCGAGNTAGYIGSAKITSIPATGTIVGIAKIYGAGLSTAFVGITEGAEKLNVPYVRWTQSQWTAGTRQRTFIAIQNVGPADLAAGSVTVEYYDRNGVLVGTDTLGAIPIGGKVSSNAFKLGAVAAEFGYSGTATGGGAVVKGPAGSKLAVVARVQTSTGGTTTVGEDYNGVP